MSYDYNALLLKIHQHRQAKEWQGAVNTFSTLSTNCPMTPLLWMQYAHDTGKLLLEVSEEDAREVRLDTLELGLAEFPGSALLQLHYVELLMQQLLVHTNGAVDNVLLTEKIRQGFDNSIQAVGQGSHRNEDDLVVQIYQHYATFVAHHLPEEDAISIFIRRAKIPMHHANDAIRSEMENFASQCNLTITPAHIDELEQCRRQAATCFNSLYTLEDSIDEAMQNEQILSRYNIDLENIDWDVLISVTDTRYWMGLGGAATAQTFIKYAQACSRFKKQHSKAKVQQTAQQDDLKLIQSLALPIYERGVAECPTVESMWLAYLKGLSWLVLRDNRPELASALQNVAARAVRNCPYSLTLAQFRIGTCLTLAKVGHSVLDPDALAAMVDEVIQANFLTAAMHHLQLYMSVIQTIKRRILFLLAPGSYDDSLESGKQKVASTNLTDAHDEEIQDLAEDLRELYDTVDKYLCTQQCSEGRLVLWADRSKTEAYLLTPLMTALDSSTDAAVAVTTESVRCFNKLLNIHQHADSFRSYIQMLLAQPVSSPQEVAVKFQRMRHYYQKGLHSITAKSGGDPQRERARQNLCDEYLEFEQLFGSEKSYGIATRLVQKVLPVPREQQQPEPDQQNSLRNQSAGEKKRKQELINTETSAEQSDPLPNQLAGEKKRKQEPIHTETSAERSNPKKAKIENTPLPDAQPGGSSANGADEKRSTMTTETKAIVEVEAKQVATDEPNGEENPKEPPATHKVKTPATHKVKVGKMEYPAHPLTVRVSNLAPETEDMDLVDTFRPRCGAVVHAKIIREHHHHHHGKGTSKGWGLVQFESQDSVDKALALHDTIGIHEKILLISRSHMPAASLVPPGMHRVKPKGEGKVSKRNHKIREQKEAEKESTEKVEPATTAEKPVGSTSAGVLAFQPRGVARKVNRKPKLSLK